MSKHNIGMSGFDDFPQRRNHLVIETVALRNDVHFQSQLSCGLQEIVVAAGYRLNLLGWSSCTVALVAFPRKGYERKFDDREIGRLPLQLKRSAMKVEYVLGHSVNVRRFHQGE